MNLQIIILQKSHHNPSSVTSQIFHLLSSTIYCHPAVNNDTTRSKSHAVALKIRHANWLIVLGHTSQKSETKCYTTALIVCMKFV